MIEECYLHTHPASLPTQLSHLSLQEVEPPSSSLNSDHHSEDSKFLYKFISTHTCTHSHIHLHTHAHTHTHTHTHTHKGFPYVIEIYDFDPQLTTRDIIREMHRKYRYGGCKERRGGEGRREGNNYI